MAGVLKTFSNLTTMKPNFAYFAGLLDGEGTLSLHRARNGRRTWKPVMIIGMCDNSALQLLRLWFPKSHLTFYKRSAPRKSFYIWGITTKTELQRILIKTFPYLTTKRPQAKLLLKFLQKYGKNYNRYGRTGTPAKVLGGMAKLGQQIRTLNKRGV